MGHNNEDELDADGDGFANWLEERVGSDPKDAASLPPPPVTSLWNRLQGGAAGQGTLKPDSDEDGLTDEFEAVVGCDPFNKDTDRDGILDGKEVALGSDPIKPEPEL